MLVKINYNMINITDANHTEYTLLWQFDKQKSQDCSYQNVYIFVSNIIYKIYKYIQ